MERPIAVKVAHAFLARVLSERLGELTGVEIRAAEAWFPEHAIFVTTTSACRPSECSSLKRRGAAVVVLAEAPSRAEEDRYRRSGAAAYLPMDFDLAPLVGVIDGLRRGNTQVASYGRRPAASSPSAASSIGS
jgi:hypothetical protein